VSARSAVWEYGHYGPMDVTSLAQPDWYIGFLEGSLRLFPPREYRGLGHDVPPVLWPGVVLPGLLFTLLAAYPFLEAWLRRGTTNRIDDPGSRSVAGERDRGSFVPGTRG